MLDAYKDISNPRMKSIVLSLIKHLHGFITEIQLSSSEWENVWQMLMSTAKFSVDNDRNEFLLLADILGVSQLIEKINSNRQQNMVGSALVGPYYRANAPLRTLGSPIMDKQTQGARVLIRGRVLDSEGSPIANAILDVWQAANNGLYDVQDDNQADYNCRGKYITKKDGSFELVALVPTAYPVPTDGPAGELLRLAQRQIFRPAHIHFIISAEGYETLVTQVFNRYDDLIQKDVVFTADDNMAGNFVKDGKGDYHLTFDFQLMVGESLLPKAPIDY